MSEYFVYVLRGNNGIFYKGMTSDLINRLKQHQANQCETTKLMNGFELVFVQVCTCRVEARSLERYLKSGYGREIITEFINS